MKSEKMLNVMENIDDELIIGAMEETKVKKFHSIGKIKWTVLAAAIALLVAVPVMAEVFGFSLDFSETDKYLNVNTNAVFAAEEFSEEVRAVKGQEYFVMQDMTEAEEFIGIDMPDNAVLEKAYPHSVQMDFFSEGNPQSVHCCVFVGENEGNLLCAHAEAWYLFKNPDNLSPGSVSVNVIYKAVCSQNPSSEVAGYGFNMDDIVPEIEEYITHSGRECEIAFYEGYTFDAMGVTVVDRMLVIIEVSGNDEAAVREATLEILDAYN